MLCSQNKTLQWRHNGPSSVPNHQPHEFLLNRLFRRRSKKTSKLRVTGLCAWNSPGTGEFPAQMARNAGNVSIWWRHHDLVTIQIFSGGIISIISSANWPLQSGITGPYKCVRNHTYWGLRNNWGMQFKNGLQNLWGNIVFLILCWGIRCHCS